MPGKIHITVAQARNLPKCDPYCILAWAGGEGKEIARTHVIDQEPNPYWDKKFTFELPTDYSKMNLHVTLMDKETLRKDITVGTFSVSLSTLRDREERDQWYNLTLNVKEGKGKDLPAVRLILGVDSKDLAPIIQVSDVAKASKEEIISRLEEAQKQLLESQANNAELVQEINDLFGEVYYDYCHPKVLGRVEITVISGRDLPIKDIFGATIDTLLKGTSDPYCKIMCGGKTVLTTIKKANLNPDWNETFTLPVMHGAEELVIDMFDEDMIGADEFMGQVIVPIGYLIEAGLPKTKQTYPLRPKKFQSEASAKEVKGTLSLMFNYNATEEPQEVEKTSLARKSDLLEMAVRVRQNFLERLSEANLEAQKAKELVGEIESIFKNEFFSLCAPPKIGELTVTVIKAQDLAKKDVVGSSDPYVVVELNSRKYQTNVIKNNLNPTWENQRFTFDIFTLGDTLHVSVLDHDNVGSPSFIGNVDLQFAPIYNACNERGSFQNWYLLCAEAGKASKAKVIPGQLQLEFSFKSTSSQIDNSQKLETNAEVLAMAAKIKTLLEDTIKNNDDNLTKEHEFQQSVADLFSKEYNQLCVLDRAGVQITGPAILQAALSVKLAIQQQIETRTVALQEVNTALYVITQAVAKLYTSLCKPVPIAHVNITIVAARNLAKKDVIGSSDPYCVVQIEGVKEQTVVKHNTLNPQWEKSFQFSITRSSAIVEVTLWDYDRVGASDHLGSVFVPLDELSAGSEVVDKWFALGQRRGKREKKEEDISGDVHLIFTYLPLATIDKSNEKRGIEELLSMIQEIQITVQEKIAHVEAQLKQERDFVHEIDNIFTKDYFTYCKPQKIADITVHVVEARGLAIKDIIGTSDPYVVVNLEGSEQKTETIFNNLNPVWNNQKFSFELTKLTSVITFTLYDYDVTGSDDFLGYIELPITGPGVNVVDGTLVGMEVGKKQLDVWLPVGHRPTDPDDVTGDVRFIVEFIPSSGPEEQPNQSVRDPKEVIKMVETVKESYHTHIAAANEEAQSSQAFVAVVDALFTPEYYEWCKPPAIAELIVQVVEARELIKADVIGSSDPYVVLEIENQAGKTSHINNTINPKWNDEPISLSITKLTGSLMVHVFDHDAVGSDESLGSASVSVCDILLQTLEGQKAYEAVLPLSWWQDKNKKQIKKNNQPITGSVFLTIRFKPIKGELIKQEGKAYQKEVEERATLVKNELAKRAKESSAMFAKILERIEKERPFATAPFADGTLNISIIGARGLNAADILTNSSDPYCVVRVGSCEHKTTVMKHTLAPVWNSRFSIPVINVLTAIMEVTVMDHDLIGKDDFLGYVTMPVSLFEDGQPKSGWFQLQSYKKYKAKGEIYMEVTYTPKDKESMLMDFAAEPDVPDVVDPAVVAKALDEVFKAYEAKVKDLEKALKGVKEGKERVIDKTSSLATKIAAFTFLGK